MHILITGAQGWLGRFVVSELFRQEPHLEIRGVGRSERHDYFSHRLPKGRRAPLLAEIVVENTSYSYQSCDLRNADKLHSVLTDFRPTHVLHLAGAVSGSDGAALRANNMEATESLFKALLRSKRGIRVIFASSGSVYGEPVYLPQDEQHPTSPVLDYARSKLEAEKIAVALAGQGELSLTVARIFNLVGPGSPTSLLPGSLAFQLAAIARGTTVPKVRIGPLVSVRDYIDIRDCARAIALAAFAEPLPIVNVSSGVGTPVQEIFELLREIAKSHGVSAFETESVGTLPQSASVHVGSNARLRELGFNPLTPLRQSLTDLFCWALGVCA